MTLRRTFVHRFAILYLSLPTVCFLLFWVRPVVGIIAASLLVFAVVRLFRGAGDCTELDRMMPSCETIRIPPFACMTLVTVLFVWCILTGQGGVVPQSSDWHWRNALFRDLITHRWPVVYPEWDRALVFYCGHWLPAACATKLIVALGMNLELSWHVGNVFLLVWTYSGVLIVFLQMLLLLNALRAWKMSCVLALLMFGDGLDVLGSALACVFHLIQTGSMGSFRVSWSWVDGFAYAHHGALLHWVFHQTVVPWIAVLLMADGFPVRGLILLVALVCLCAPLSALGLAILAAFLLLKALWDGRNSCGRVLLGVFSAENLIAALVVFPVVAAYLLANPQSGRLAFAWAGESLCGFMVRYVVFVAGEVGLYLFVTGCRYRRSVWWWWVLAILLACPLVLIGEGLDFSMRVSIPAVLVLLMFVLQSMFGFWRGHKWASVVIACLLLAGTAVPVWNMWRFCREIPVVGLGEGACDSIVTFDRDTMAVEGCPYDVTKNCCRVRPDESFFYGWLARRPAKPAGCSKTEGY